MKAVILAAGKGERLKDITGQLPKPMIPFRGKPVLEHNLDLCRAHGITDIYMNLHHLPHIITDYFGDGSKFDVSIRYSFEEELLGTSGAVNKISRDFWNDGAAESFFVIYGDNYSHFDLSALISLYNKHNPMGVIAFHHREDVQHSGVAEFDADLRVTKFIEKPKPGQTDSHWVNAGIYFLNGEILNMLPEGASDFAKEIFPVCLKQSLPLYGVCDKADVLAFDTPDMYNRSMNSDAAER